MPDVTIAGDAVLGNNGGERHGIIFPAGGVTGYFVYTDDSGPSVIRYRKTLDGGATWAAPITVSTGPLESGAMTVYYPPYTPGISTRLIHIIFTQNAAIVHRTLDPNDDSFSTVHSIVSGPSAVATKVGLGQARAGDLWVYWASTTGDIGNDVRRSTNGGVTWSDPGGPNPIEADEDDVLIMPASNTGDDADMWFIYHDDSANETSLKFWDNSVPTFTEASIVGSIVWGGGQTGSRWMAGVWHDDGHLSLLQWTNFSGARDLQCWEINSATSFTQRANVRTADGNGSRAAVTLDQNTGRLYVAWMDGAAGSVDQDNSDDRGATWSGATEFSDGNPGVLQRVYAPMSIAAGVDGRWMPAWFANTPTAHETNFDNSLLLLAPPVPAAVTTQQQKLLLL